MSMGPIHFDLSLFKTDDDRPRCQKVLLLLLHTLMEIDKNWILDQRRQGKNVLPLYQSPVKYSLERIDDGEWWQDIPTTLGRGYGDCKVLAGWRGGELRAAGIAAKPWIEWRTVDGSLRYHALVKLPNGRVEDPSSAMGMATRTNPDGRMFRRPVYIEPTPIGQSRDEGYTPSF